MRYLALVAGITTIVDVVRPQYVVTVPDLRVDFVTFQPSRGGGVLHHAGTCNVFRPACCRHASKRACVAAVTWCLKISRVDSG